MLITDSFYYFISRYGKVINKRCEILLSNSYNIIEIHTT